MKRITKDRLEARAVKALGPGAHVSCRESPIGWVAEAWTPGGHVGFRVTGVSRADGGRAARGRDGGGFVSTPRGPELDAEVRDATTQACRWPYCVCDSKIADPCPLRAPEPDEAERVAREWLDAMNDGGWHAGGGVDALATLLRAAEARGRDAGLEEAARECAAEIASYDSGTHEYFTRGAQGCISRILALQVKQ